MFKGNDTELVNVLNAIAEAIHDIRFNARKDSPHFSYEPKIIAYIGMKQFSALMSVDPANRIRYEVDKFMGASVIRVMRDDYLHVVLMDKE